MFPACSAPDEKDRRHLAYVSGKGDEHAARKDTALSRAKTLTQLHAELAGKIEGNRNHGDQLRAQMVLVEAVLKMLEADFNVRAIGPKSP
jgi:hypothetical protein